MFLQGQQAVDTFELLSGCAAKRSRCWVNGKVRGPFRLIRLFMEKRGLTEQTAFFRKLPFRKINRLR